MGRRPSEGAPTQQSPPVAAHASPDWTAASMGSGFDMYFPMFSSVSGIACSGSLPFDPAL